MERQRGALHFGAGHAGGGGTVYNVLRSLGGRSERKCNACNTFKITMWFWLVWHSFGGDCVSLWVALLQEKMLM